MLVDDDILMWCGQEIKAAIVMTENRDKCWLAPMVLADDGITGGGEYCQFRLDGAFVMTAVSSVVVVTFIGNLVLNSSLSVVWLEHGWM